MRSNWRVDLLLETPLEVIKLMRSMNHIPVTLLTLALPFIGTAALAVTVGDLVGQGVRPFIPTTSIVVSIPMLAIVVESL